MVTFQERHLMEKEQIHLPVMNKEVQEYLNLKPGDTFVDCTLGLGGHAREAALRIGERGRLVGIDRDGKAIEIARERLADAPVHCDFVHDDFRHLEEILGRLQIKKVNGILMDLGVSSMQLNDPERGFSIRENGPLDMRMNQDNFISAYDLVNSLTEHELSFILKKYGEERWHGRIARYIVQERSKHPIETTKELSDIVWRAVPAHNRYQKIHPATRSFQAIRIAVNRELESLEIVLGKCIDALAQGGRLCVISFHSLEDRIVKHTFRLFAKEKRVEILTKKPLRPNDAEVSENIRARSARFRAVEKI
ncbi:MAG: 16S rRNA (cytosine(1402)-N(4))-methyltransferase RsmH [Candidatus Omnitrophota bacterium]